MMTESRDLSQVRREYAPPPIDVEDLAECPFEQFDRWFKETLQAELLEPNAMVLATVSAESGPASRTVLLKYFDRQGFVFFTNYGSRKARQIEADPRVSVLFPWYGLQRQVEIDGVAEKISVAESVRYFASRPRGSQIGAWVSHQSTVVSSRSILESKYQELKRKFAQGDIPVPTFWGGYRIRPERFEFWQGGRDRLHDRFEYLPAAEGQWKVQRLAP